MEQRLLLSLCRKNQVAKNAPLTYHAWLLTASLGIEKKKSDADQMPPLPTPALPILPKAWPQSYSPNLFHPNIRNWLKPRSSITSRVSCADAPLQHAIPVLNSVAALPPDPNPDPQKAAPNDHGPKNGPNPAPRCCPSPPLAPGLAAPSPPPDQGVPTPRTGSAEQRERISVV